MGASCTTKIQYEHPAEEEPLAKEPPTKKEPPQEPSQEEPPKEEPPKEEPPKEEPPKEEPPKEEPPKEEEPPREEAKEPETKNDEDMVWDDVFTNLFKQLQIYQIRIARKGKIITTIDIKGTDKVQTLKNKLFAKEGTFQCDYFKHFKLSNSNNLIHVCFRHSSSISKIDFRRQNNAE
eukprot:504858_1